MNKTIIFSACLWLSPFFAYADNQQQDTDSAATSKTVHSSQTTDTIIKNNIPPQKNQAKPSEENSRPINPEKQPTDVMTFCRTHTC